MNGQITNGDKPVLKTMRNPGHPIVLSDVTLCGVTAEPARAGENVSIFTRMSLTSDDDLFHQLVENFTSQITALAYAGGHNLDIQNAKNILLVMRADNSADLWVDTAMAANALLRRSVVENSPIFEDDIADIVSLSFPHVTITESDRLLCIFRKGWRFGLFFDFNPSGKLAVEAAWRDLARLFKRMQFKHLYSAVADPQIFNQLLTRGWFPFTEIASREFRDLANCISTEANFAITEEHVVAGFSEVRLDAIANRWIAKPAFSKRKDFIDEAVTSFREARYISVIKIVSSEVEGILRDAYIKERGENTRHVAKLLDFALKAATGRANDPLSLLLPLEFINYLRKYTFAQFEPGIDVAGAGSRHAVNHGAAEADSYTAARALQSLLTLDQLGFYL